MRKYIVMVFLLLSISLIARENPFMESNSSKNIAQATLTKDTRGHFSEIKARLPSTARILNTLTLSYQNLDGSIENKSIKVDKKIDWHDELILKKVNDLDMQRRDKVTPIKIYFKDFVSFSITNKEIYIKTNDTKIRDFLVSNPYKIVLDFQKKVSFYTKTFKLETKRFKKIRMGRHSDYYRVVIQLDRHYKYLLKKVNDGIIVTLL
jgi:hypothetical protein